MPASQTADRLTTAGIFRTCNVCATELPLTPENFYRRAGREYEARCQSCRRARNAEVRAARRRGTPVRGISARKFGVEIEFIGNASTVAREMTALGLNVSAERYNHSVRSYWKIVPDASVPGGMELVSPPLSGARGIEDLRKACRALASAGASVDRTCGLHVHHEITDLSAAEIKRLIRGWDRSQDAIDNLVAPSRRNGRWARRWTTSELSHFERLADSADIHTIRDHMSYGFDRYRALNLQGFPRYGTAEVRQHQGTTNADKIVAWIYFGQAMVARAKDKDAELRFADTAALLSQLRGYGLATAQADYLTRRAARLAGSRVQSPAVPF